MPVPRVTVPRVLSCTAVRYCTVSVCCPETHVEVVVELLFVEGSLALVRCREVSHASVAGPLAAGASHDDSLIVVCARQIIKLSQRCTYSMEPSPSPLGGIHFHILCIGRNIQEYLPLRYSVSH